MQTTAQKKSWLILLSHLATKLSILAASPARSSGSCGPWVLAAATRLEHGLHRRNRRQCCAPSHAVGAWSDCLPTQWIVESYALVPGGSSLTEGRSATSTAAADLRGRCLRFRGCVCLVRPRANDSSTDCARALQGSAVRSSYPEVLPSSVPLSRQRARQGHWHLVRLHLHYRCRQVPSSADGS